MAKKVKAPEKKVPSFDLTQLPSPKDPSWREEENRFLYEENLRIYLYSAMDRLDTSEITPKERNMWNRVVANLAKIAELYASKGYSIHIH